MVQWPASASAICSKSVCFWLELLALSYFLKRAFTSACCDFKSFVASMVVPGWSDNVITKPSCSESDSGSLKASACAAGSESDGDSDSSVRLRPEREEAQHLPGGVRTPGIDVRTLLTAARPGMGGAVHEPVLGDDASGVVTVERSSERVAVRHLPLNHVGTRGGGRCIASWHRLGEDFAAISRVHRR